MTRDEMLEKLHHISSGTHLTWLPDEYAIECQYVTPEGTSYEWIGQNDWPAYELHNVSKEVIDLIINKLIDGSLTEDDIQGNELLELWKDYIDDNHQFESCIDICSFFDSLRNVSLMEDGTIYVIVDYSGGNDSPEFFSDYNLFENAFIKQRIRTKWEEFSDDELNEWIDIIEEYEGINTTVFSALNEEDDENGYDD